MTIDIYDAAILEVRNQASPEQVEALKADPIAWRDSLQKVVDELEAQLRYRQAVFEDESEGLDPEGQAYQSLLDDHKAWKKKARTFLKHNSARLTNVKRLSGVQVDEVIEAARVVRAAEEVSDTKFEAALDDLYRLVHRYDAEN
jgi:hypothetical protein